MISDVETKQTHQNIELDAELRERVASFAHARGVAPAQLLRQAFDEFEANHNGGHGAETAEESVFDSLNRAGLIGCIDDPNLPTDLSTNPKYLEGFGRD